MSGFVHLHVHSEYSLLDGACRIKGLIARAKELGQTAVAVTDHGVMYGVVDFYKEAKKAGIKPIIGCEVYVAARTRFDKNNQLDGTHAHLVLLCKNEIGYRNLVKLVSAGFTDGFYSRPRIDRELLEKYHDGLLALSACIAGEVPSLLLRGDYDGALRTALWYDGLFGRGNYFLEIQDHGLDKQRTVNPQIIRMAHDTGIPLVCTNDAHYLCRGDAEMQKVLVCIQTNTTIHEPSSMSFDTDEFYVKSEDEMRSLFPQIPAAFDNTVKIAEQCNAELEFGKTLLPKFDVPGGDSAAYFRKLCREGMHRIYGENPDREVIERLEFEMSTIERMGYVDYYLIVSDFIRYAKSCDIPVGPGRGSGAASLCAYCVGITGIDPLKYQLLFERFLNPERVSMPDFDIDFCNEKRQQVIDYVVNKYGADRVAQIVTFGTMAARAAIRDVARAMGIPYALADRTAKLIPWEPGVTLEKAMSESKPLSELADSDPRIQTLIDMAKKVEGMPRHTSTHAAGVVIMAQPVSDYVPLCLNGEAVATQYTMNILEELGLLKMDFLGLRNLTVINDAQQMIRRTMPEFDIEKIPIQDQEVFDMMSGGYTEGVFQFESAGMKRVLHGLRPDSFEDLIAVISLYRPGPMDSIPRYIHNRHNPTHIKYAHPLLEPILCPTNGCIIYQEQVMQIFRELAGYSLGRADIVRRAMAKKKHGVMEKEREIFIRGLMDENGEIIVDGCERRGVSAGVARQIFSEMESFASYAFPKAHGAAYALVAYRTAWLKFHYPKEYIAALLTSLLDGSGRTAGYIAECTRLGITVLPPSVNHSGMGFTVEGDAIRFGLLAVKNVGRGLISELISERGENGLYRGFYDFCQRLSSRREFNARALDGFVCSGALDGLGANRRQMRESADIAMSMAAQEGRRRMSGQIDFFDLNDNGAAPEMSIPDAEEYSYSELIALEKDVTGMYITGHPLMPYSYAYSSGNFARIDSIITALKDMTGEYRDGQNVVLFGMITSMKRKTTKSDAVMVYAVLEDLFGTMEILVFPRVLSVCGPLLEQGKAVVVKGRISALEDEPPKLIADSAAPPPEPGPPPDPKPDKKKHAAPGLYIKAPSETDLKYTRARLALAVFEGCVPVMVKLEDTGAAIRLPRSMWTSPNAPLLAELKNILGEDNVVLVG